MVGDLHFTGVDSSGGVCLFGCLGIFVAIDYFGSADLRIYSFACHFVGADSGGGKAARLSAE